MEVRGGLEATYHESDTITIDVFLDATGPLTLLSFAVLSTASALTYCPECSAALPIIHPSGATLYSTGAQPGYILYSAAVGMTFATSLYPQQTPNWLNFPPPSPEFEQVAINYAEPGFRSTAATGDNIWIASLVYHVICPGFTIEASLDASYSVVTIGLTNITSQVTLTGGPIYVAAPEPTTALLLGFGLLGVGLAARHKL